MAIESSGLQHEVLFHRKWGPNGGYRVRGEVATVGGARPERSPVGPRSPTHLRSLLFVLFLLCNGCSSHRVASSLHLHPQARVSFSCPFRVVEGLELQCSVGLNLRRGRLNHWNLVYVVLLLLLCIVQVNPRACSLTIPVSLGTINWCSRHSIAID